MLNPLRVRFVGGDTRRRRWDAGSAAVEVALVTPLRDGMNLVAKEYVACQENRAGALILSEFAGASSEMGEAFFVNPYDEEGMAARIAEVMALPEEHLRERMAALHQRICRRNVNVWA